MMTQPPEALPEQPTAGAAESNLPGRAAVELAVLAVTRKYGRWMSHNVEIAPGLFTMGPQATGDAHRLRGFLAMTAAIAGPVGPEMRVLDLGCGEGLYGLEYAGRGAHVLGIEIRTAHIAKCRLAKWALAMDKLELIQGDIRHISPAIHGSFDVVICSGVLYHLDTPDVFHLVENIAAMTGRVALFDTRIALAPSEQRSWRGMDYEGAPYREHASTAGQAEKNAALWSSHDNDESFWLTRQALLTLLERSGFGTVLQLQAPSHLNPRPDRITLAAIPGPAPVPNLSPV